MEKLPGVESAKVSLNEGRAVIQLRPGNTVTIAQVHQSVERNGFTPQQAAISGEAEVVGKGDKLQLRISGAGDTYDLATTPHADGVLQRLKIECRTENSDRRDHSGAKGQESRSGHSGE
ncbi:MAG: hypothetical protein HY655_04625 [Acidobacteria bacterium]|nr:hypothetical protein [Acidobacteriota bacterium]